MSSYEIYLRNSAGVRVAFLDAQTVVSLKMAHTVNTVGTVELVTSDNYSWSYIQQDGQLEIYRTSDAGIQELLEGTLWLIVSHKKSLVNGQRTYTIIANSGLDLLERAIVAYPSQNAQAIITSGYADDNMKRIVKDNLGSLVNNPIAYDGVHERKLYNPPLTVAANTSAAAAVQKAFAWQKLLPLIQGLAAASAAAGIYLFFDVVWNAMNGWTFNTYVGQRGNDLTTGNNQVLFSPENENIRDVSVEYDYRNEVNYVYAGGQGLQSNRDVAISTDLARIMASPVNRREAFVNARNTTPGNTAALQGDANAALRAGRPLKIFTGQLFSTPTCEYGTHWHFGDKVRATFDQDSFICWIDAITLSIVNGQETIGGTLRSIT